jgi:hypothetical protein
MEESKIDKPAAECFDYLLDLNKRLIGTKKEKFITYNDHITLSLNKLVIKLINGILEPEFMKYIKKSKIEYIPPAGYDDTMYLLYFKVILIIHKLCKEIMYNNLELVYESYTNQYNINLINLSSNKKIYIKYLKEMMSIIGYVFPTKCSIS